MMSCRESQLVYYVKPTHHIIEIYIRSRQLQLHQLHMRRANNSESLQNRNALRYRSTEEYPMLEQQDYPSASINGVHPNTELVFTNNQYDSDQLDQFNDELYEQEQADQLGQQAGVMAEHENIFEIQQCKLSPIINTCLQEAPSRQIRHRQISRRVEQVRHERRETSPSWKVFINPDIDKYYQELIAKRARQQNRSRLPSQVRVNHANQFHTPKNKNNSQYSLEPDLNPSLEVIEQPRISQHMSLDNAGNRIKSTRNKSTIENELDTDGNRIAEDIKKKYEDKISVLEHQNTNLKDQLFYLRAAILAQYQAHSSVPRRT